MVIKLAIFCAIVAFIILRVYGTRNSKGLAAATGLLLGWSILQALYGLLVGLLSLGPTDFNGHPNAFTKQVPTIIMILAFIGQLLLVVQFLSKPPERRWLYGLVICAVAAIAPFIVTLGLEGLWAIPNNANVVFVGLYVGYIFYWILPGQKKSLSAKMTGKSSNKH